jgi:hypothetical protein
MTKRNSSQGNNFHYTELECDMKQNRTIGLRKHEDSECGMYAPRFNPDVRLNIYETSSKPCIRIQTNKYQKCRKTATSG